MRIAKVIGKVVLNRWIDELQPGTYLIVRPQTRAALAGGPDDHEDTIVAWDNLGAREGDLVGLVEGREATAPFYPAKVPYSAYCACIIDRVDFDPVFEV
jgi:microcompartment protein CcmK/EutM